MVTPAVTAITTPARKEAESFSALGTVTKMIADMICGPAFIVMARGMTARLIGPVPPAYFQAQDGRGQARPARSRAVDPNPLIRLTVSLLIVCLPVLLLIVCLPPISIRFPAERRAHHDSCLPPPARFP